MTKKANMSTIQNNSERKIFELSFSWTSHFVTGVLQVTIDLPRNHPLYDFLKKEHILWSIKLQ